MQVNKALYILYLIINVKKIQHNFKTYQMTVPAITILDIDHQNLQQCKHMSGLGWGLNPQLQNTHNFYILTLSKYFKMTAIIDC